MSKLVKAEVLIKEAMEDLNHGCYNKAVSASYFAIRLLTEHFIPNLTTTKDDKIANALFREVERRVNRRKAEEMRYTYLFLFSERKRADHRADLFEKEEAKTIVEKAVSFMEELKEIFKS
ncbi:MAG: HEPN domain-containing protein [Candidatus Methanodesulfokora sp.]|nr:MAG: hypothetical protein C0200_03405 [Candidatus Korarchaeota archaeon]